VNGADVLRDEGQHRAVCFAEVDEDVRVDDQKLQFQRLIPALLHPRVHELAHVIEIEFENLGRLAESDRVLLECASN